jgi:hypothetical protein
VWLSTNARSACRCASTRSRIIPRHRPQIRRVSRYSSFMPACIATLAIDPGSLVVPWSNRDSSAPA